jgi:nucleoside-diphosphate-sugar epimerase
MNFCHLDDAVAFVLAALDRGAAGGMYHGTDAYPARRAEVVRWVADLLGVQPSTTSSVAAGPNRRIKADWTCAQLGVSRRWPSFKEGLAATPIVPSG